MGDSMVKNFVRQVKIGPLKRSVAKIAKEIARMQGRIYPKEMQESEETIQAVLDSTDLSRGVYKGKDLIGYGLVKGTEDKSTVYLYDIAILPEFQQKGYGTRLIQEILRSTRARNLRVAMHARSSGYRLLGKRDMMRRLGYEVVKDEFLPDWYFNEFGIHEDARELLLQPTSSTRR